MGAEDVITYTGKSATTLYDQIDCTSVSGTLVAAKANRISVAWINQSSTDVIVCWGSPCNAAEGMRFKENQGYVDDTYRGIITCITASGTATIGINEK